MSLCVCSLLMAEFIDDEHRHWIFFPERHNLTMEAMWNEHPIDSYELVVYMQYRSAMLQTNAKKFNPAQTAEIEAFDRLVMDLNKGRRYFCICLMDLCLYVELTV